MEKKKNDIPDWKKQIDNMKTNERDELKSLQRKQGKDSWKKKKELDKLKYDNSVKRNKKNWDQELEEEEKGSED
jgi:hypothetical protein|tara:strand:+ start:998 stop:1219 length:222 start_codon:yes stop_codon:yes gene_type:complete